MATALYHHEVGGRIIPPVAEEYLWWLREGDRELMELEQSISSHVSRPSTASGPRPAASAASVSAASSSGAGSMLAAVSASPGQVQSAAADSCFRVLRLRTGAIEAELASLQREVNRIVVASNAPAPVYNGAISSTATNGVASGPATAEKRAAEKHTKSNKVQGEIKEEREGEEVAKELAAQVQRALRLWHRRHDGNSGRSSEGGSCDDRTGVHGDGPCGSSAGDGGYKDDDEGEGGRWVRSLLGGTTQYLASLPPLPPSYSPTTATTSSTAATCIAATAIKSEAVDEIDGDAGDIEISTNKSISKVQSFATALGGTSISISTGTSTSYRTGSATVSTAALSANIRSASDRLLLNHNDDDHVLLDAKPSLVSGSNTSTNSTSTTNGSLQAVREAVRLIRPFRLPDQPQHHRNNSHNSNNSSRSSSSSSSATTTSNGIRYIITATSNNASTLPKRHSQRLEVEASTAATHSQQHSGQPIIIADNSNNSSINSATAAINYAPIPTHYADTTSSINGGSIWAAGGDATDCIDINMNINDRGGGGEWDWWGNDNSSSSSSSIVNTTPSTASTYTTSTRRPSAHSAEVQCMIAPHAPTGILPHDNDNNNNDDEADDNRTEASSSSSGRRRTSAAKKARLAAAEIDTSAVPFNCGPRFNTIGIERGCLVAPTAHSCAMSFIVHHSLSLKHTPLASYSSLSPCTTATTTNTASVAAVPVIETRLVGGRNTTSITTATSPGLQIDANSRTSSSRNNSSSSNTRPSNSTSTSVSNSLSSASNSSGCGWLEWGKILSAGLHHENRLRALGTSSRILAEQHRASSSSSYSTSTTAMRVGTRGSSFKSSVYTDIRVNLAPLLLVPAQVHASTSTINKTAAAAGATNAKGTSSSSLTAARNINNNALLLLLGQGGTVPEIVDQLLLLLDTYAADERESTSYYRVMRGGTASTSTDTINSTASTGLRVGRATNTTYNTSINNIATTPLLISNLMETVAAYEQQQLLHNTTSTSTTSTSTIPTTTTAATMLDVRWGQAVREQRAGLRALQPWDDLLATDTRDACNNSNSNSSSINNSSNRSSSFSASHNDDTYDAGGLTECGGGFGLDDGDCNDDDKDDENDKDDDGDGTASYHCYGNSSCDSNNSSSGDTMAFLQPSSDNTTSSFPTNAPVKLTTTAAATAVYPLAYGFDDTSTTSSSVYSHRHHRSIAATDDIEEEEEGDIASLFRAAPYPPINSSSSSNSSSGIYSSRHSDNNIYADMYADMDVDVDVGMHEDASTYEAANNNTIMTAKENEEEEEGTTTTASPPPLVLVSASALVASAPSLSYPTTSISTLTTSTSITSTASVASAVVRAYLLSLSVPDIQRSIYHKYLCNIAKQLRMQSVQSMQQQKQKHVKNQQNNNSSNSVPVPLQQVTIRLDEVIDVSKYANSSTARTTTCISTAISTATSTTTSTITTTLLGARRCFVALAFLCDAFNRQQQQQQQQQLPSTSTSTSTSTSSSSSSSSNSSSSGNTMMVCMRLMAPTNSMNAHTSSSSSNSTSTSNSTTTYGNDYADITIATINSATKSPTVIVQLVNITGK